MPGRAELIRQATDKARTDWLHYTMKQEDEILKLFDGAADRLVAEIGTYAQKGVLPPARLTGMLELVKTEAQAIRASLAGKIRRSMSKSVDYGLKAGIYGAQAAGLRGNVKVGIGTSFIGKDGLIRRYDAAKEALGDSAWAKINGDAMDALMRYRPTGLTFADSVWDVTWQAEKSIRNCVNRAVLLGESPARLSRDIRGFLAEPEKLFRRVRKDGKLVLSKAARDYHPGRGVYRSAYKNAMRLTRTEMGRAYHEGTIRYAHQKTWIDGGIWRAGSGDPCTICADMNGQFFKKDEVPAIPHSQCMCWIEWHIQGEELPAGQHDLSPDTLAAIGKTAA